MGTVVRPLGLLEKYYSSRHSLRLYNALVIAATYSCSNAYSENELQCIISAALAKVVHQHAILCCTIQGGDGTDPVYFRKDSMNLDAHIQYLTSREGEPLEKQIEMLHDQPWELPDGQPPWKLVILNSDDVKPNSNKLVNLIIAFVYNHTLADGSSGAAFHECFLEALQEISSKPTLPEHTTSLVEVDKTKELASPIEKIVNFKLSFGFLLKQVLQEYGPKIFFGRKNIHFSGADCEVSDQLPYISRVRTLEIDSKDVKCLLSLCKREGIYSTSLLSACLVVALSSSVPDAVEFTGSTPYSLRRLTNTSPTSMVCQVSGLDTVYDEMLLSRIRTTLGSSTSPPTSSRKEIKELLWEIARNTDSQMRTELADIETNNSVGLLPYVSDFHSFYRKKLGVKREKSFEVSNVGIVGGRRNRDTGMSKWKIEKAAFSQPAAVVGPALTVSVASVFDGNMVLCFDWQDQVVAEEMVQSVMEKVKGFVKQVVGDEL